MCRFWSYQGKTQHWWKEPIIAGRNMLLKPVELDVKRAFIAEKKKTDLYNILIIYLKYL